MRAGLLSHTRSPLRRPSFLGTVLALGLSLGACAPRLSTPVPGDSGVYLADDFSKPTSGWDVHTGPDLTTDYDNGRYLIAVEEPGVDVWAVPGLVLSDVRIEVDTQHTGGPVDNEFGVICRYARSGDSRDSFYFFLISSDGYYAMGKVVKGERTILAPPERSFQPSASIRLEPDAINRLSATCQGNRFAFAVNGSALGEFTDDELPRGDVGLIAGTYDEGGVRIHFDNALIRAPG